MESKNGHIVIVAPIDGSPAQKAGLQPGDVILKVNGEDVSGQDVSTVVEKIVGPSGSKVTITIQDPDPNRPETLRLPGQRLNTITLPGASYRNNDCPAAPGGVFQRIYPGYRRRALTIKSQGASG